jgi:hypothetical protein
VSQAAGHVFGQLVAQPASQLANSVHSLYWVSSQRCAPLFSVAVNACDDMAP